MKSLHKAYLAAALQTAGGQQYFDARWFCRQETALIDAAGAADDQHIFDLNVRLQYSDDAVVLTQALQVRVGNNPSFPLMIRLSLAVRTACPLRSASPTVLGIIPPLPNNVL